MLTPISMFVFSLNRDYVKKIWDLKTIRIKLRSKLNYNHF